MIPIPIITSIISGVTGHFSKKQDIKSAGKSASVKLANLKESGAQNIKLTDAEWESLSVKTQQDSWKDEYVTIIITSPMVLIIIGSLFSGLGFESGGQILNGSLEGIKQLKELGMDYGFLINSVVLAAIGLKVWRS